MIHVTKLLALAGVLVAPAAARAQEVEDRPVEAVVVAAQAVEGAEVVRERLALAGGASALEASQLPLAAIAGRPKDPADSLYRVAREALNRGEYRRASQLFGSIPERYPRSAHAADALYWQAFALYRIGTTEELRAALAALDARRARYADAGSSEDVAALATRIRGALAARGDAGAAQRIERTASSTAQTCDKEDLAVRIEALREAGVLGQAQLAE